MTADPGGAVLALDASTLRAAAALVGSDGAVLGRWRQAEGERGTASLAPAVARLLQDQGLAPGDLLGLAVGTGPGSYTGLRSALAFARGLALPGRRPVVGLPSPASSAAARFAEDAAVSRVVGLIDARRGQVARCDHGRGEPGAVELLAPHLVTTEEAAALRAAPPAGTLVLDEPDPDAIWLAHLARPELVAGGHDPHGLVPLYLKPSHAELALRERGTID